MATSAEIRNQALRKLGVLGAAGTASSEDSQDMDKAYNEVYAQLDSIELAYFTQDNVPDEVSNAVAAKCAWARVSEHLVSEARFQRVRSEAIDADRVISAGLSGRYHSSTNERDY